VREPPGQRRRHPPAHQHEPSVSGDGPNARAGHAAGQAQHGRERTLPAMLRRQAERELARLEKLESVGLLAYFFLALGAPDLNRSLPPPRAGLAALAGQNAARTGMDSEDAD